MVKIAKTIFIMSFVVLWLALPAYSQDDSLDKLMADLEGDYNRETKKINDPLEPINRVFFKINDTLMVYVLKPVTDVYSQVFPKNFREGISRGFNNLRYPVRAINRILQLNLSLFFRETERFILNTALGFGGLIDVASGISYLNPPPTTDTGITLGKYGIGHGFYLVLPVLGPSSLRDGVGTIVDSFLDPLTYVEPNYISILFKSEDKLNKLSFHIKDYEDLKASAMDPYISFRNAYLQNREYYLSK